MTGREKRKKLLVAESEAYRQLLKLEAQNLRIHGLRAKQELTSVNTTNPLMTAIPLLTSLLQRKDGARWKNLGALAVAGWQFYRLFNPPGGRPELRKEGDAEASSAEEYLKKRL